MTLTEFCAKHGARKTARELISIKSHLLPAVLQLMMFPISRDSIGKSPYIYAILKRNN